SRRRHTRFSRDWSSDVCSSDLLAAVTPELVEKVIAKEAVDAIALAFGGQTALNCGLALHDAGVLAKHGIQVLGTPIQAIRDTERSEERRVGKESRCGG